MNERVWSVREHRITRDRVYITVRFKKKRVEEFTCTKCKKKFRDKKVFKYEECV